MIASFGSILLGMMMTWVTLKFEGEKEKEIHCL